MTPARFRWGMALIAIGFLLLLENMRVLEWNFAWDLLFFLPIVLISIGIEKIFTRSRLEFISYLTTLAIFAGIGFTAYDSVYANELGNSRINKISIDPSIEAIHAVLNIGGGELEIRDSRKNQIYYKFDDWTPRPRIRTKVDGSLLKVYFDSRQGKFWGGILTIDLDEDDYWKLAFAREIPLTLECYGDESRLHLNLTSTPLRELNIDADKAFVTIRIGSLEPLVKVEFRGDESELRLRVPWESGLRVKGIDDKTFFNRIGLVRDNGSFVNEDFESRKRHIEVDMKDEDVSLSIDFY